MVPINMTPTKLQERLSESEDSVDIEAYLEAVRYVRDDGGSRR
jgi:hypothetical protein